MGIAALAVRNLSGRPFRTFGLITVVAVLAFSLFAGSVLVTSLGNGAENVEERLGADLMLVPKGSGYAAEAILLKGEPNEFYMDKSVADEVVGIKGISKISTQFYLTTISDSDCCDFPVQLISFDPKTDFTVTPWIESSNGGGIGYKELVIGSEILLIGKDKVKLFGREFPVAATLSKSGTGLDTSIYMTEETMKFIAVLANELGCSHGAPNIIDTQTSTVLIKAEPGYNPYLIGQDITFNDIDVDVVQSKDVAAGLTKQMSSLIGYVKVFEVMLWLLAIVVLGVLFSVSVNERKKEFATFRMMGATRRKLSALVLGESSLISIAGALIGTGLAALFVIPFSDSIGSAIGLPYLAPSLPTIFTIFLLSVTVAFVIGPLTAIWSARRIGRSETHSMFTEGN
jgi:putative ABC transport system permease protein